MKKINFSLKEKSKLERKMGVEFSFVVLENKFDENSTVIEFEKFNDKENNRLKMLLKKAFAENYGYEIEGYEYRTTGSSGRLSDHAYGGAIDINARHNPMTGPKDALKENDGSQYVVNEEVIDIFAKYGFYWGGDWNTSSDPMHFSFTGW